MFNNKLKKESIKKFEEQKALYEAANENIAKKSEELFNRRKSLKDVIDFSYSFINTIKNTPHEYTVKVEKIRFELGRYNELLELVQKEIENSEYNIAGKSSAAAGAAIGTGIAAFGPSAAMAIAMTFGTASTGTAIASLSGIAATNAALAWLGGGALAAGGAGIAGGSAFLALAGPLGLAIGAIGITTGGLLMSSKNKKTAIQADEVCLKIKANTVILDGHISEIINITENVEKVLDRLPNLLKHCLQFGNDYSTFTEDKKYTLGTLVNNTEAAVELLNLGIGENK